MRARTFLLNSDDCVQLLRSAAPRDPSRSLALVFGDARAPDLQARLEALGEALPGTPVVGCSSAGHVLGDEIRDDGLAAALLEFEEVCAETTATPLRSPEDSFDAGQRIAQRLADPALRAVLVYAEGLAINGAQLAAGLAAALPDNVAVAGGLAGDGDRFERTWVCEGRRAGAQQVVAAGLYGEGLQARCSSNGGWEPFGPVRCVTRSNGAELLELDNEPALQVYKRYLGDLAAQLPASALLFPLAVRVEEESPEHLVRTVLGVDEQAGSLLFAGDIPQGACAQLMRASPERLIHAAAQSGSCARPDSSEPLACLSIVVSCVGRRLVLGQRAEEELEAALHALPVGALQTGFYSYGEIAPLGDGACALHNQTMTLTTITESLAA